MPSEESTAGADRHLGHVVDELKRELEAKSRELAEAREQQAATAGILAAISSSPADLRRVFAEIAASAARLCDAYDAAIHRVDGDFLAIVAHHGPIPAPSTFPLRPGFFVGRAVLEQRTVHVVDVLTAADEYPEGSDRARSFLTQTGTPGLGFRTILAVPLIRAGKAIGVICIRRQEVRAFTDRQIELLRIFADQAVIAIENTRLFEAEQASKRELQESLEYQTATSEILGVISSSPTDLRRVMDSVAESAARVCAANDALIYRIDGEVLRFAALYGTVGITEDFRVHGQMPLTKGTVTGRAVLERRTVHVPDLAMVMDSEFPDGKPYQQQLGFRTALATPLLKEGVPLGAILIRRMEVNPFTDKQIALLETFADQAVIAIENTRLFEAEQASKRELQESLRYQTAISEVLGVISRSQTEIRPVFDAILESAVRLCDADQGGTAKVENGMLIAINWYPETPESSKVFRELRAFPRPVDRTSLVGRAVLDGKVLHVPDLEALEQKGLTTVTRRIGYQSQLTVPLLRNGQPIGVIALARKAPEPFTAPQIALATTFADQAVIAIENTRLFEEAQTRTRELTERTQELTETLEYQTATSEVLSVISRSPTNVKAVFETIAKSAARLCSALNCFVYRFDGKLVHFAAAADRLSEVEEGVRSTYPLPPGRASAATRAILNGAVEEIPDVELDTDYQHLAGAHTEGYRSIVAVPMLKDGRTVGAIAVSRSHVGRFPPRQIELLQTFAGQAVIAIENTRLFEEVQARTRELSEALEQQTATADVLKVISRSALDLQKVLDALVESAARLCDALDAAIFQVDGRSLRLVAAQEQSFPPGSVGFTSFPLMRRYVMGRAVIDRRTIHVADMLAEAHEYPESHKTALQLGFRTLLTVPLVHAGEAIGVIVIRRAEVRPFTERQIELVNTFADQAVIAIENTRLFKEVQSRSGELARSVQELHALAEVGRAVSSTLDLKVVLKTIVDRAVELSGTDAGSIYYYRQELGTLQLGETTGLDDDVIARFRNLDISVRGTGIGEAIAKRQPLQIADLIKRPSNPLRDAVIEAGLRAALVVPLLGAEGPLGALTLQRRLPGEFPQAVVSLMQTFADQSAIALENARLFNEIAQKSRELEIASQHKSQFVANMSHELRTPLAAILGYAELMQEGFYEPLGQKSLDALTRIRSNGKHLLGLINTILDIAKIESGQFTLNMTEYAIESVVETVRSATESLAQNKKLSLKTEVATSLPIGLGDEQRLTQVLLNLVGNAIKFTARGEVRVTAKAVNGHFNVSVTDTGPGIPDHEQTRIFEHFHQVDSSLTKAAGGTGLGLAIAKQIVEMHGGRIWVESTVGKGSTFQMEIPTRAELRMSAP